MGTSASTRTAGAGREGARGSNACVAAIRSFHVPANLLGELWLKTYLQRAPNGPFQALFVSRAEGRHKSRPVFMGAFLGPNGVGQLIDAVLIGQLIQNSVDITAPSAARVMRCNLVAQL